MCQIVILSSFDGTIQEVHLNGVPSGEICWTLVNDLGGVSVLNGDFVTDGE